MTKLLTAIGIGSAAALFATDAAQASAPAAEGTQAIVIQGFDFTIPAPYAAGHALTANEASAFNQLFAENIRNNSASRIKTALAAATAAGAEFSLDTSMVGEGEDAITLRQSIEDYAETYEFGARRTSTKEPVDPVQREAYRIAKEAIGAQLAAKGIKIKDLADGVYDTTVEGVAKQDKVQKLAAKRVKEREGLLSDGDFDVNSLATKPAPAEGDDAAAPEA